VIDMEALVALLRFPFYSIARRSYQIRPSLLLPSPSALKGALAKGIILLREDKGEKLDEIAEKTLKELNSKLLYVGAKPYRSIVVKSPILLKRLRNLESSSDPEKSDAMRREYTFAREILAIYVFRELTEEEKTLYLKAAYLIDQLGDTESLGSVVAVQWVEVKKGTLQLNTYLPLSKIRISVSGIIDAMLESPSFTKEEKEVPYVLPLSEREYKRTIYYVEKPIQGISSNHYLEVFGEVVGLWI